MSTSSAEQTLEAHPLVHSQRTAALSAERTLGYRAAAHHDTDANDDLDRPYFSLPLEPYGYSNGAWTSVGLPDWEEVAFNVGPSTVQQAIHIRMNAFAALAQMMLIGVPSLLVIFGGLALFRRRRAAHI